MIVVGLMSGTSGDGIDAAVVEVAAERDELQITCRGTVTVPFGSALLELMESVLPPSGSDAARWSQVDTLVGQELAEAAAAVSRDVGVSPHLIATHGQTIYHWVEDGRCLGTLQVGQPAWIWERLGVPVVSDLRAADVAAGGQGAPLAPIFDRLLLSGRGGRPAALNLGGIANITVVEDHAVAVAYDTGPANALIDAAARWLGLGTMDQGGRVAASGQAQEDLLRAFLADEYFARAAPKTTGREHFNADYLARTLDEGGWASGPDAVAPEDLLATVTEVTAITVADACREQGVTEVVASGGGTQNATLMRRLASRLNGTPIVPIEHLGVSSSHKEAVFVAVIGVLSVSGVPGSEPQATGARGARVLGSLTPPNPAASLPLSLAQAPSRVVMRG